jgi:hypothetical protein
MSALQKKVTELEGRLEKLERTLKTLGNSFDTNANVLKLVSVAVNLISEKIGVSDEQVKVALAKEFEEALKRKSAQSGPAAPSTDSGNQRSDILPAEGTGDDTLVVAESSNEETHSSESPAGDNTIALGSPCSATRGHAHEKRDFEYDPRNQEYVCRGCGEKIDTLSFEEQSRG